MAKLSSHLGLAEGHGRTVRRTISLTLFQFGEADTSDTMVQNARCRAKQRADGSARGASRSSGSGEATAGHSRIMLVASFFLVEIDWLLYRDESMSPVAARRNISSFAGLLNNSRVRVRSKIHETKTIRSFGDLRSINAAKVREALDNGSLLTTPEVKFSRITIAPQHHLSGRCRLRTADRMIQWVNHVHDVSVDQSTERVLKDKMPGKTIPQVTASPFCNGT